MSVSQAEPLAGSRPRLPLPDYPGKAHFTTDPVAGFAVRNLPEAVDELRDAGIELLGEAGPTWQQFRGPDGNVYELVSD